MAELRDRERSGACQGLGMESVRVMGGGLLLGRGGVLKMDGGDGYTTV